MKFRDDALKKVMLQKHNIESNEILINRDKDRIKEEMREKEKRCG